MMFEVRVSLSGEGALCGGEHVVECCGEYAEVDALCGSVEYMRCEFVCVVLTVRDTTERCTCE